VICFIGLILSLDGDPPDAVVVDRVRSAPVGARIGNKLE
jgi:hypothetical protein